MRAQCWGRLGRRAPWPLTVHPNGGNLRAPQGNGWQMYPGGEGGEMRKGGGERMMWWRRGRQSWCVLWSLSYGFSLSGLSLGALRESGSGRHPYSQNPRLSSSIQSGKSLHIVNISQYHQWHSVSCSKETVTCEPGTAAWIYVMKYMTKVNILFLCFCQCRNDDCLQPYTVWDNRNSKKYWCNLFTSNGFFMQSFVCFV